MTTLVGILNLTPDSFSDGGEHAMPAQAIAAAEAMIAAGAHIVDIGAESTRPGAVPLSAAEEWKRLAPVLEAVAPRVETSVDTRHAATAKNALALGARWINDVGGLGDEAMIAAVRDSECGLIFMHSLSIPADPLVTLPEACDPVAVLIEWARARIMALEAAGIARARLVFDPGIGFGKTQAQSLAILRRARELRAVGIPVLIGHSRKSCLRAYSDAPAGGRDAATLAVSAQLLRGGVEYLRVHDVAGHTALLRVWNDYNG